MELGDSASILLISKAHQKAKISENLIFISYLFDLWDRNLP